MRDEYTAAECVQAMRLTHRWNRVDNGATKGSPGALEMAKAVLLVFLYLCISGIHQPEQVYRDKGVMEMAEMPEMTLITG